MEGLTFLFVVSILISETNHFLLREWKMGSSQKFNTISIHSFKTLINPLTFR